MIQTDGDKTKGKLKKKGMINNDKEYPKNSPRETRPD